MLTIADAPQLFQAVRACYSNEGRKQLIELHLPLVMGMARKYARRVERQPDDYIGEAELALVEAVDTGFRYMIDDQITKYLVVHVKRRLQKYYREDRVVTIPARTQDELFRLGHMLTIEIKPLEAADIAIINREDLLDALLEVLPELIQRQVCMLRLARHNDREIAILLSRDVNDIRRIRRQIKTALSEMLGD